MNQPTAQATFSRIFSGPWVDWEPPLDQPTDAPGLLYDRHVDVQLRNGLVLEAYPPGALGWSNDGRPDNIVKYRVRRKLPVCWAPVADSRDVLGRVDLLLNDFGIVRGMDARARGLFSNVVGWQPALPGYPPGHFLGSVRLYPVNEQGDESVSCLLPAGAVLCFPQGEFIVPGEDWYLWLPGRHHGHTDLPEGVRPDDEVETLLDGELGDDPWSACPLSANGFRWDRHPSFEGGHILAYRVAQPSPKAPPPRPRVVLYIEGGNLQGGSATPGLDIDLVVIDADNLRAEGLFREEINEIAERECEGLVPIGWEAASK